MKFNSVLICSAATLLAAAPVWADRIDIGGNLDFGNPEAASRAFGHADLPSIASQKEESKPSNLFTLSDRFDPTQIMPLASFRIDTRLDPIGSPSGDLRWASEGQFGHGKIVNATVVTAPEPGTSLLVLLGLSAFSLFGYRRRSPARTVESHQEFCAGF
jgi:hypothetical protein